MVIMSTTYEQRSSDTLAGGIFNRLYSCDAQIFVLSQKNPENPDWVELSDQIVPVHIVHSAEKNIYQIWSVQHNKVILNSPIDLQLVIAKGSPKFLQYTDSSNLKTYGIGFDDEKDAVKFETRINGLINEMKIKIFAFTPTSFVTNGTTSNNISEKNAAENSLPSTVQVQTSILKPIVDNFPIVDNSPPCDLMSIERDRVKNALIANVGVATTSNGMDLDRILKKMENLERENRNLRDCILAEPKGTIPPKSSIIEPIQMLMNRYQSSVVQNDVNSPNIEYLQMHDALNNINKEKQAAEKKLTTILRICKYAQTSLTEAMNRINEIESLVESQLKSN